jgi:hypothetical protein
MTEGSKYHPLFEHLLYSGQGSLSMSFSEIEAVLEARLPPSARTREEWWSNSPSGHSQARAWMRANYRASVDLAGETATFVLNGWPREYRHAAKGFFPQKTAAGLSENPQAEYRHAQGGKQESGSTGHPLFGIWKGKVTLLPDHDYTKPAFEGGKQP